MSGSNTPRSKQLFLSSIFTKPGNSSLKTIVCFQTLIIQLDAVAIFGQCYGSAFFPRDPGMSLRGIRILTKVRWRSGHIIFRWSESKSFWIYVGESWLRSGMEQDKDPKQNVQRPFVEKNIPQMIFISSGCASTTSKAVFYNIITLQEMFDLKIE